MSSDEVVIRVQDVGKCFEVYKQPQDRFKQFFMPRLYRALNKEPKNYFELFWALQHISFEVTRGQSVGILGQNGSGKSTLLQLIAGILTSSYGNIEVKGRVGALIELGSGFNPDFTGRENVFLNGSLLGLSNEEIDQKFDNIAAFADIGSHLELPVKTYSSGMMLRLAFAVQMAVEPDILIIDEALAVGDAKFQLKCFKQLNKLKDNGTTILFVSHDIETVRSLCHTGIVINGGQLIYDGYAKAATTRYLSILFPENYKNVNLSSTDYTRLDQVVIETKQKEDTTFSGQKIVSTDYVFRVNPEDYTYNSFGAGGAKLNFLEIHGLTQANVILSGQTIKIFCDFSWDIEIVRELLKEVKEQNIAICIALADRKGVYIFGCNGFDAGIKIDCLKSNHSVAEFLIKMPYLIEGDYYLTVAITIGSLDDHKQLKWYDYFLPLKILKSDKTVFGQLAVSYNMKIVKTLENYERRRIES